MANVPQPTGGPNLALNYTRGEWATAVSNAVTGNASNSGGIDFIVGWTVAEMSVAESKVALYNCLNCSDGADIASYQHTTLPNHIVSFKSFQDGVNGTAERIKGGYPNIVKGLSDNSLNPRTLTSDTGVQQDLGKWVNGPHGGRISGSYITNIISGSGHNSEQLYGLTGDQSITNQTPSGGDLNKGGQNTPPVNPWSWQDVVKVALGALMLLTGLVLFIKAEFPSSGIAKTVGKVAPFL